MNMDTQNLQESANVIDHLWVHWIFFYEMT